jgi:hypothetical protein
MDPFKAASKDPKNAPTSFLGPPYSYMDHISTPGDIGVRADGSLGAIVDDISGMVDYLQVLIPGGGRAVLGCAQNQSGCTLGNQYFLKTAQKCKDISGEKVTRSIYINNVVEDEPLGDGLIPGVLHNLGELNPFELIGAFMAGPEPSCRSVTLRTGSFPNWSTSTGFITDSDLQYIPACSFPDKKNPSSGATCKEGFSVIEPIEKDKVIGVYHGAVAILAMYIIFRIIEREHRR